MMSKIKFCLKSLLAITLFWLVSDTVLADDHQLQITSDHQQANVIDNVGYFTGNVLVIRGNNSLKADKITVNNNNSNIIIVAEGKEVVFNQQNGKDNIIIIGSKIIYDVKKEIIEAINATVKDGNNTIISSNIYYDLRRKVFNAKDKKQVKTIIKLN